MVGPSSGSSWQIIHLFKVGWGNSECGAGLASGVMLPSYIVYTCKHLYNTWCQSGPAGAPLLQAFSYM